MSGPRDNVDTPDLGPPEYLCYRILKERHQQDNQETGRTKFFKLSTLADHHLINKFNRNIGLPRHWYMYGEVVEEPSIAAATIAFRPSANHQSGQAYYPANNVSESDFDVGSELAREIQTATKEIVNRYGKMTREELEKHQYSQFAPNNFIIAYSNLRWHLVSLSLDDDEESYQVSLGSFNLEQDDTEEYLDEMLASYPDEYETVYDSYLDWDDTMRLLIEQDAPPTELQSFFEFFIEKLSQIELRFAHNESIPEDRLKLWREERPKRVTELEEAIAQKRSDLFENRQASGVLESVNGAFSETMREEILRD